MAIRVTDDEVRSLLEDDPTISMDPFITAASLLTDRVGSNDTDSDLAAADLKEVERWLSAHMYSCRDQQLQSRSTDNASGTFTGKTDMGLDSTYYGQTAQTLDVTGYLTNLKNKATNPNVHKAGGVWLGTEYSEANGNVH